MNAYSFRSAQTELIDKPDIPFADWEICLRELDTINRYLGGHAITTEGMTEMVNNTSSPVIVAEIGCGGGDNLKAIHRWSIKRGIPVTFVGIDINEACIQYAIKNCAELPSARFIASDYRTADFEGRPPDVIFSSLFCHHFSNAQLVEMLLWLKKNATLGFFINDLHRHPAAFHSIRLLTRFFSRSYLVKNDAPISVMRGFRRRDWQLLMNEAGIKNYSISWRWAFRYLVSVKNDR